uniref:Uncharacterized protein n=1 Tax=Rhizophora mucronata TaxID=61149 RepID=A0A2P2NQK9_RHIMU
MQQTRIVLEFELLQLTHAISILMLKLKRQEGRIEKELTTQ